MTIFILYTLRLFSNIVYFLYFILTDNYTEELLERHEKEVTKMKARYECQKNILEKLAKREKLFQEMIEFEVRIQVGLDLSELENISLCAKILVI